MNEKQTIIFFSRMGLTHLYGSLDSLMNGEYNIIHIAYSNKESKILQEQYGVTPESELTTYISNNFSSIEVDLNLLKDIEEDFRQYSSHNFTLASAIISDRTLEKYSKDEVYEFSIIYYNFWKDIYKRYAPSFIFHETVTQLYNHTASILAKKFNCIYSGFIATTGIYDNNFRFVEYDNGDSILLSRLLNNKKSISELEIDIGNFIDKTINKKAVLTKYKETNLVKDTLLLFRYSISSSLKFILLSKKIKLLDPGAYYGISNFYAVKKYFNRISYKFNNLYKNVSLEQYYFFPLHVEPEAVLAYWSEGKYSQVELIEQIARNIPAGEVLYVKDHKDELGYRSIKDYKRISSLHNVKLLHPAEDSLELIKNAKGIIVINGTVGLEAAFFNKPVCMFGNIYYKTLDNIFYAKTPKDIQSFINNISSLQNTNLKSFLRAYLESNFEGNIRGFFRCFKKCTTDSENIKVISKSFKKYIKMMQG